MLGSTGGINQFNPPPKKSRLNDFLLPVELFYKDNQRLQARRGWAPQH
jgi:hypothetical protein